MIDKLISAFYQDKTRIIDRKRWYRVVGEKENTIVIVPYETRVYNDGTEKTMRKSVFPKRVEKIGVKYKGRIIIRGTEYWPAGEIPDCADDERSGITIDSENAVIHDIPQPDHIPTQVEDREYESDEAIPGSIPNSVTQKSDIIIVGSFPDTVDHEYLLKKWNEEAASTYSDRQDAFEECINDLLEQLNDELSGAYAYNGEWGQIESVEFNNSELMMNRTGIDETELSDSVICEVKSMYDGNMIIVEKI